MERLGNYEYINEQKNILGTGSFSIVYLGRYIGPDIILKDKTLKIGNNVAIKVVNTGCLKDKAKQAINEEITMMELIKSDPHPNIVRCYDVIKKENTIYIIMEYCDSGDLKTILKKPIKEKYAQFYFCQLANGLKYLYKHCLIHRDIKPKNILLTNNKRVLKIADFGFAKRVKDFSLHETICGSPLYMAPEIMNNSLYNNQTDLWSIGMILFEMLYGFHPFGNCRSMPELKDQLDKKDIDIPPNDTKNKEVSDKCLSILKKLLEKNPIKRITWEEFFDHSWIKAYQYNQSLNNSKNEEYEKQLFSTSLGSILNNTPPTIKNSSVIFITKSNISNVNIIKDYMDNYINEKSKPKEKLNKSIEKVNYNDNTNEFIFDMDIDDCITVNKKN